jgi:hypothetical protein
MSSWFGKLKCGGRKKLVIKNGRMFLLDMDAPPLPANRYFSANQGITP